MTTQKTRETTRHREAAGPGSDPFEENTSNLREQAASYADIARAIYADCQHGAEAEQELQRRRNQSGQ